MSQTDESVRAGPPPRIFFRSIRTRLAVCLSIVFMSVLLLVELLGLEGIPFSAYTGRIAAQKAEVFASLNLIADIKKERLRQWLEGRRDDAHVRATSPLVAREVARIRSAIRELSAAGMAGARLWTRVREETSYRDLVRFLRNVQDEYGVYDRIQIADADTGTIILSTDDATLGGDASQLIPFREVLRSSDDYVSDVEAGMDGHPVFHIAHVIYNEADRAIAALLAEIDANDIIGPMLHRGEGLGRTGEALLVNRELQILTSLKYRLSDGTAALPLEHRIQMEPAVLAAGGEEGIIEARDYRGEPVLAAYRHIRITPEFGWGLVVKRDAADVFASVRADVTYTALIGLFGVIAVVFLTSLLVRTLTGPIVSLGRTAERVANGDLEARAPVTTSDEIGTLATTFNSMIGRVQHWRRHLEEQVAVRTAELRQANVELKTEIIERKRAEESARVAQEQLLQQQRSETKRIQAELDKTREQLIVRTRLASIGQVAASIAHELRNPLGAARNAAYYIKRYVSRPEPDLIEHLNIIDEEINAADHIITDLMNMTRSTPPVMQEMDFGQIVREVLGRVKLGEQVHCRISLDPDPFMIHADPGQLRQVIGNLLSNAAQALEGKGEIVIAARQEKACREIDVRDNGPGVAADHRDRLFEPLFTTKAKGTGLGLTICREIIQRHGGSIELVDTDQPGAAFRIRLPR